MSQSGRVRAERWAPLGFTVLFMAGLLLRAGTSPMDLLRYGAYIAVAILLPGTLVYRALRRRPHTLVEDLAMGAAVGLTLEIAAWALFSSLDLRVVVWLWPAVVAVPFLVVPALRRHWRVGGYTTVPLAWSWSVAAIVCFFTAYLAMVFIDRNPILPPSENTRQYLDLAYQLSLAGEATHSFPVTLPQVAGDPLYYHWFGYGHMAMTSMVGQLDLPVVALRLTIPALCALAILLTAVVGWRVSRRPYVGVVAAALFFVIGEFNFTNPVTMPFGTQTTFVIWHGMSMIYSWVLLLAVVTPLADIVAAAKVSATKVSTNGGALIPGDGQEVPPIGRGSFVLAALLLLASSGAKASSLPVVAVALAGTAVALLVQNRRIPWGVVLAGIIAAGAQLFATAVLYRFQTYGVKIGPLQGLSPYWSDATRTGLAQGVVVAGVWVAFGLNMLARTAGIVPLVWLRRGRLDPVQWFLVFGALAGPAIYLIFSQPSSGNQYFTRAGFAFGVLASAWGYVLVFEQARLAAPAKRALALGTVTFAVALVWVQLVLAGSPPAGESYSPLVPILWWAGVLGAIGVAAGTAWFVLGWRWPFLRGRGALVALTFVLVAGAPGLIMDEYKSVGSPNGGAYATVAMPKSRVDAARWVRDNSSPTDVIATNVHCIGYYGELCDSRSFWLSAYAERSVLVEGWAFAPRMATGLAPFWDQEKLALNDSAFTDPTPELLRELREEYGVRYLVVDRVEQAEAPTLGSLATLRFTNGRMAVYELTAE